MLMRDEFGMVAARGHRRGGTIPVKDRERHWIIAAVAVAALSAAYGAYSSTQAASQQASYAKRAAKMAADSEAAAGEARAKQIQYEADKKQKSFLSRAAGAGVDISSPSLLESETQFAYDVDYAKQLARYPHEVAGWSDKYQSDLFGFQSKQYRSRAGVNAGIAGAQMGGSTLASGYGKGGSYSFMSGSDLSSSDK